MSKSAHTPRVLRFGVFDVNLPAGELRKAGTRVKLQQQPFQVLEALLERPGEVVTREELQQRLWPADTFVDFDLGLNSALKKLRYALGDDADHPVFIETVTRKGYRFIAPVTPVASAATDTAAETSQEPTQGPGTARLTPRIRWRSWPMGPKASLILIPALILLASLAGWRIGSSSQDRRRHNIESVAVLPLENLSGDPAQDYFADGMTDQLITNLGQLSSLRVISRTSAMQYRGVHKPLPQIARELNVDAIVEGTVVRSGERVRITAQLIQASEDRHLWAQSFEGEVTDVLSLQHEISRAVANQVRLTLIPQEQIRPGIKRPLNLEAYEAYLRGEYYLNRFTPESIHQAAGLFQQAIEKDPEYVPAYCKLSGCYRMLANMGALPIKEGNQKAKAFVAKALELDPDSAPAHAGNGFGLLFYDLDFAAAGAEFKRAVELNTNSVEAHLGLGEYYTTQGQMQSAVRELQYARELDPLGLIVNNNLCRVLVFARRYDEALVECKANLDLESNAVRPLWFLGEIYTAKGMESEAVSSLLEALRHGGASSTMIAAVQAAAQKGGPRGYWQALVKFIPEGMSTGDLGPFEAAAGYAYAGEADKAMPWLEKAVEIRSYGITFLGSDPMFDSVRSDPRFIALLKKMGLPQGKPENS